MGSTAPTEAVEGFYKREFKVDMPDGEWLREPDFVVWIDEETGYRCFVVRHPSSWHLCGYVAVPERHPMHGKGYDDPDVQVHGGLTFGQTGEDCFKATSEKLTEPIGGLPLASDWVLGFDCAHSGDLFPQMITLRKLFAKFDDPEYIARAARIQEWETYRDLCYVEGEVESLAKQLKALEGSDDFGTG